jgi:acetoin utilization deacetylase AcuC-like enzyme
MQKESKIRRAMVVDCDVHQGNGTAGIFAPPDVQNNLLPSRSRPALDAGPKAESGRFEGDVFTISLHQEANYPVWKPLSSIDVNLPDGIGDREYLSWLDNALSSGLRQFTPDLICYLAGADPYKEDQLGGLNLTIDGLKQRDELVYQAAKARGIPVMVTLAGGYAINVEDTVTVHCNTVAAAKEVYEG